MRQISWSAPALGDLRAIDTWLEENRSPEFATRTLATIRERARFLEDFPHGGRPSADGIRILRVHDTPYLILYRLQRETVEVVRIRHEREDWLVGP